MARGEHSAGPAPVLYLAYVRAHRPWRKSVVHFRSSRGPASLLEEPSCVTAAAFHPKL
jgi:hypothetical protein